MKTKNLYLLPVITVMVLALSACENKLVEEIEPAATVADSVVFQFNPGFYGEQITADSFQFTFYVNYKNETNKYIVPTGTAYFTTGGTATLTPVVFGGREQGIWGNDHGNAGMYGNQKCHVDTAYVYGPGQQKIISGYHVREKIIVKINVGGIEKTATYNFSYNF